MLACMQACHLHFWPNRQQNLDKADTIIGPKLFNDGCFMQKALCLIGGAEPHHFLYTRPVIPGAVE